MPASIISEKFPFHIYFSNAPSPLFHEKSYEDDLEIAAGCFRLDILIFYFFKEYLIYIRVIMKKICKKF